jgi:hypothetical protein
LGSFKSQELSNLLWAAASTQQYDAALMEAATAAADGKLPEFKGQELANTAWALAKLRHRDPAFMRQLLEQTLRMWAARCSRAQLPSAAPAR